MWAQWHKQYQVLRRLSITPIGWEMAHFPEEAYLFLACSLKNCEYFMVSLSREEQTPFMGGKLRVRAVFSHRLWSELQLSCSEIRMSLVCSFLHLSSVNRRGITTCLAMCWFIMLDIDFLSSIGKDEKSDFHLCTFRGVALSLIAITGYLPP